MNWLSSGRYDDFRYALVDKSTMKETKDLDMFLDGGTIEYNDLTAIKVSGSLPFITPPQIGFDYLRVYSMSRIGDETEEVLHGTFIATTPQSDIKWQTRTGEASVYSLLQIVADAATRDILSIPAGTNAISYASTIIKNLGLSVIADNSTATLNTAANFDAGTKWLEIVTYLCTLAGFASADVDAVGNIRLYVYTDPALRSPSIEFIDDERCVYHPTVKYEFDIFDVPNTVIITMSNQDTSMTAVATNTNPMSIYSTVSRGREIAYHEEVSDIDNMTALQALADRRLAEKTSAVESVVFSHNFVPYGMGEVSRFVYSQANFDFTGAVVKKSIKLVPGMPCDVRLRRFVRG